MMRDWLPAPRIDSGTACMRSPATTHEMRHTVRFPRVYSVGYPGTRGTSGARTELTKVSGTGVEFVPNLHKAYGSIPRVYSVGYPGTRGTSGARTKLTEVSGTGVEFVPNLSGLFGRVLRPYRTLPRT